jgi:hypothetical protein
MSLPPLHGVEVERNVERLGLPDQHVLAIYCIALAVGQESSGGAASRRGRGSCRSAEVSGFAPLFFAKALCLCSLPML